MKEEINKENPSDTGQDSLINDLKVLLQEAEDFAFHDFKNEKYAAPKMAFTNRLKDIISWTVDGKYDNQHET